MQALRAMSATEIIVVDPNEAALAHAKQWGADHVVQARGDRSHVQEVRDLTGDTGAQVVIDYVGEHGAERDVVELLGARGVGILVGYGATMQVDILDQALAPETSFLGSMVGTHNDAEELIALNARGAVKLSKTTQPLDGINDILHALDDGRLVGRGVVVPNKT